MRRLLVVPLFALALQLAGCPEPMEEKKPEDLRGKAGRLYQKVQDANERARQQQSEPASAEQ